MQATDEFRDLVAGPARDVPLDRGSLLIAAHADPSLEPAHWIQMLDELADACSEPTFAGLRHLLFEQARFEGDTRHYADPSNSLLHRVLARRTGIPITLAIVMIEVGRRLGVGVEPIGMPGHFLVRDPISGWYCDPFERGALLDAERCRARFEAVFAATQPFSEEMLAPVTTRAVLARVLANLERGPLGRDLNQLAWMVTLHAFIPGLSPAERLMLADLCTKVGNFAQAARELDTVASTLDGARADELTIQARALRARAN